MKYFVSIGILLFCVSCGGVDKQSSSDSLAVEANLVGNWKTERSAVLQISSSDMSYSKIFRAEDGSLVHEHLKISPKLKVFQYTVTKSLWRVRGDEYQVEAQESENWISSDIIDIRDEVFLRSDGGDGVIVETKVGSEFELPTPPSDYRQVDADEWLDMVHAKSGK